MKKKILCIFLVLATVLTGCGNTEEQTNFNTSSNDYLGACNRILETQEKVFNLVKSFQKNDDEYGDLNNYWENSDYFYLNFNPLDMTPLQYTYYYNEEQCDWNTTVANSLTLFDENTTDTAQIGYYRLAPNQYRLIYPCADVKDYYRDTVYETQRTVDSTYQPNKDWLQTVASIMAQNSTVEDDLYEYARINNGAIIQTKNERLLVFYNDLWESVTMPVLKYKDTVNAKGVAVKEPYIEEIEMEQYLGRGISEMYYSKLSDIPRQKYLKEEYEYAQSLEYSDLQTYMEYYRDGDDVFKPEANRLVKSYDRSSVSNITCYYNSQESLFNGIDEIDEEWVINPEEIYQTTIVYQNGNIRITELNNLSKQYEEISITDKDKVEISYKPCEIYDKSSFDIEYLWEDMDYQYTFCIENNIPWSDYFENKYYLGRQPVPQDNPYYIENEDF